MSKKQITGLIIICITMLTTPLIMYFSIFNDGLSNDSSKWRDFSTFVSLFVAIINMMLIGTISWTTSRTTALFQERQLRPHIYVSESKTINKDFTFTDRTWKVINSSNVVANNILIRYSFAEHWTNWLICFSLGSKEKLELGWVNFARTIQICYCDIESRRFFLYEITNWTGVETAIEKSEFEVNLESALKKRNDRSVIITNNLAEDELIEFFKGKQRTSQALKELEIYLKGYLKEV